MDLLHLAIISICFFMGCSYVMSFAMLVEEFQIFNNMLKLYDLLPKKERSLTIACIKTNIVKLTFMRNLSCILHWTITLVIMLLVFFCLRYTNFEKGDVLYELSFGLAFALHFALHFYQLYLFRRTVKEFNGF